MVLTNTTPPWETIAIGYWGYDVNRVIAPVTPGETYLVWAGWYSGLSAPYTVNIQLSSGGIQCPVSDYPDNIDFSNAAPIQTPINIVSDLCMGNQYK